ncbi:ASCH domain-containing protein [Mesobacillus sp. AQ2]|uniref:ASCH domain-containing protein n=1 Tax=Bacillaceae TaxID=186817 RepID=UPI0021B50B7E|nr:MULTISPECIES: ASCH domain-containing protein [Bacillaceae]WHX41207.1 ASCH domain-containing protein [Mesobacillus sp. AQ2]
MKRDEKIQVGNLIEFVKVPEQDETLTVKVTELRSYDTFKEMYENIPFHDFDCEGWTMKEMVEGTYEIYTPQQEKQWGALAITIKFQQKSNGDKFRCFFYLSFRKFSVGH